jgi:hypothetical protein
MIYLGKLNTLLPSTSSNYNLSDAGPRSNHSSIECKQYRGAQNPNHIPKKKGGRVANRLAVSKISEG